jgi:23S rRNA pseudouridine1911/1915/1917 synthase
VKLRVLYEDNHLLVVDKPAGLLAQRDASGRPALVDLAKAHRKSSEGKPGDAYIGLVHRLDEPVSGVVVLAKTSKAAARLSEQFRARRVRKEYLAVVEAPLGGGRLPPEGAWTLWQDQVARRPEERRPAKEQDCRTECRLVGRAGRWALLALRPITGRKHQLREQAALRGLPIVGDRRYGSQGPFEGGIALHAAGLRLEHPVLRKPMQFRCPPPGAWRRFPFAAGAYLLGEDP